MSLFKVILVGSAVGKTQLLNRLSGKPFNKNQASTISVNFKSLSRTEKSTYQFWDISSLEKNNNNYQETNIALLCFDPTNPKSFKEIQIRIEEIKKVAPDCRFILIETKSDLLTEKNNSRKVEEDKINDFIRQHDIKYHVKTSAQNNDLGNLIETLDKTAESIPAPVMQVKKSEQPSQTDELISAPIMQVEKLAEQKKTMDASFVLNTIATVGATLGVLLCLAALVVAIKLTSPVSIPLLILGGTLGLGSTGTFFGAKMLKKEGDKIEKNDYFSNNLN
ncbi:MAG: GTP-binding protein [Proteobacteria bacterium]|nr:GTP-binding protein [Pseudomonadota bacterium]